MTQVQETIVLRGHIIDSLILAKVLDLILMMGGSFDLDQVEIGRTREDQSHARIVVRAPTLATLNHILHAIQPHGAVVERDSDCVLQPAPADGVFPDGFYSTTHLPTEVRLNETWVDVQGVEMDLGIRVDSQCLTARTVPMADVRGGDLIVTGQTGVRVMPLQRPRERDVFDSLELGDSLGDSETLSDGDSLELGLSEGDSETDSDGDSELEGDSLGEAEIDSDGDSELDGDSLGDSDGEAELDGDWDGLTLGLSAGTYSKAPISQDVALPSPSHCCDCARGSGHINSAWCR